MIYKNKIKMKGNNVSKSNCKTKRFFFSNKQQFSTFSRIMGKVKIKFSSSIIQHIKKRGDIDLFLLNMKKDFTKMKKLWQVKKKFIKHIKNLNLK